MAGIQTCLCLTLLLLVSTQFATTFSDKVSTSTSNNNGGFASASASASSNGQGGTVSTSTSPGGSHSVSFDNRGGFPNVQSSNSYAGGPSYPSGAPSRPAVAPTYGQPSYPAGGSGPFPSGGNTVSSSSSSHSGPDGTFVSTSNNVNGKPQSVGISGSFGPNGPQSVGIRGSFEGDDQSIGVEVDGTTSAPGAPYYPSGSNFGYPGFGYPPVGPYATPFGNNQQPGFGGQVDIQSIFQQYFAALQAQQQAFQQQLQAQIQAQQQAIWDQANRVDSNFNVPSFPSNGGQFASAGANIGPQGGYQYGQISPASPGIFSRFGEDIPAPSGNSYGVFSSSSSSSGTGPDGRPLSRKSATVGVNNNGKVSYKTVHDP